MWGFIAFVTAVLPNMAASALQATMPAPAASTLVSECERKAFQYFVDQADPVTGIVKDRAANFGTDNYTVGSTAATGFGLAALVVGARRGWITRQNAVDQATRALKFYRYDAGQEHGWLYHFVDVRSGKRAWNSEVSSIDTALFLAGALLAGQAFPGTGVKSLADAIYRRVDFQWMLTDGGARPGERLLCHGWTPEHGFLPYRWDSYSEQMILYILAMGSPTHPIPAACWDAWKRPMGEYAGFRTFISGPLFTYEFSQAFVDFRGRQDRLGLDYWTTSMNAVKADRQFCIDNSGRYHTYGPDVWGLSACDGPDGYRAYSAPPGPVAQDGTVAPLAVEAAVPLDSHDALAAMQHMRHVFWTKLWGRYGFSDAFNLDRNWFDQDVIGIDLGCAALMLENYRTGLVWKQFMAIPAVQTGLNKAGLKLSIHAERSSQATANVVRGQRGSGPHAKREDI
jgi:hypothetical protein